ncbi:hypothetical protein [Streptosporangium sp. NPDC023615]|uniref:hypothetical protein n=1 Tax=Streptosporangium sp. NPDC023615 TaxID=3154794 RepID=UPI0034410110
MPIPAAPAAPGGHGGHGGHGGGDAMLLDDVFRAPAGDPLHRRAGFLDGAASVMVGIAGNESLRTARAVCLEDLGLSSAPAADHR